jgi:NAD(P)-dependent dehydrogenase (short-subunit alcohol dehydrogenase family)
MADHWTAADIGDLTGTTAVVTGSNAGLGLEIAAQLAGHGARVVMACRNQDKAAKAADEIRSRMGAAVELDVRKLDLSDLASVRAFAGELLAEGTALDLLINNAGLMAVDHELTADGFEMQLGVNHLGHFVLTAELLPLMVRNPGSRIASMSSMGHRAGRMHFDDLMFEKRYHRWPPYFQSKLANLLFTAELQRRLASTGAQTIAVAAHPGGSHTDLGTEGSGITNAIGGAFMWMGQEPDRGALPMLRAATAADVEGGQYYGPHLMIMGRPVLETPSRHARNAGDARRLWTMSEELTGVEVLGEAALV